MTCGTKKTLDMRFGKGKSFPRKKGELVDTEIWECPNGHWSRAEFPLIDKVTGRVVCPLCYEDMKVGTKRLEALRKVLYDDYNRSYGNSPFATRKVEDDYAKDFRRYRNSIKYPCQ